MRISILLISVILSSFYLSCSGRNDGDSGGRIGDLEISIKGHAFSIEIADTPEERRIGYMEREEIGQDEGMLFVFPDDRKLSFWMKNTPTPLSIAYIDSKGVIREIYHMDPYSEKAVPSRGSVRYALEVVRGRFEELGIGPGDILIFPGKMPAARE